MHSVCSPLSVRLCFCPRLSILPTAFGGIALSAGFSRCLINRQWRHVNTKCIYMGQRGLLYYEKGSRIGHSQSGSNWQICLFCGLRRQKGKSRQKQIAEGTIRLNQGSRRGVHVLT